MLNIYRKELFSHINSANISATEKVVNLVIFPQIPSSGERSTKQALVKLFSSLLYQFKKVLKKWKFEHVQHHVHWANSSADEDHVIFCIVIIY